MPEDDIVVMTVIYAVLFKVRYARGRRLGVPPAPHHYPAPAQAQLHHADQDCGGAGAAGGGVGGRAQAEVCPIEKHFFCKQIFCLLQSKNCKSCCCWRGGAVCQVNFN